MKVNKQCIDLCYESNDISINNLHEFSVDSLTKEIKKLPGFSNVSKYDVSKDLFPHYIGHHLGLDLHDIPSVSRFQKIKEGNVITIEPGLYIPMNDKYPKWYQGIGIRVEDDVVVGNSKNDIVNLTSGCVKEIARY